MRGKPAAKHGPIKELEDYISARAKRGRVLPTGYNGRIMLEEITKPSEAAPE